MTPFSLRSPKRAISSAGLPPALPGHVLDILALRLILARASSIECLGHLLAAGNEVKAQTPRSAQDNHKDNPTIPLAHQGHIITTGVTAKRPFEQPDSR